MFGPVLRIRQGQLDALRSDRERQFARDVARYLRDNHAGAVAGLDDAELERRVLVGLARGRKHGLSDERMLLSFISLMFRFAPNFDEHPRLGKVLRSSEDPPGRRFQKMVALATQADWEEVQRARDESAWAEGPASPWTH